MRLNCYPDEQLQLAEVKRKFTVYLILVVGNWQHQNPAPWGVGQRHTKLLCYLLLKIRKGHITMDFKCVTWLLYFAPVLQLATIKSESRLKHLLQRLPGYCPESMVSLLPLLHSMTITLYYNNTYKQRQLPF